ncbi:10648_t:CDS:2 [Cetraspora pellucida]|uniref:10648_t:CDS:1 n=1 Tax=Cetraspora pellucida TaxID=1433469 RepID=A0ACA9KF87_9GLOM|nr:10648_t:CDS:2 [Cetraspora pellucida]
MYLVIQQFSETLVDAGVEASSSHEAKKSFCQQEYIDLNAQDDEKDEQPGFEDDNEVDDNALIEDDVQEEDLHPKK